jgi:hypothetical protein
MEAEERTQTGYCAQRPLIAGILMFVAGTTQFMAGIYRIIAGAVGLMP